MLANSLIVCQSILHLPVDTLVRTLVSLGMLSLDVTREVILGCGVAI